MLKCHQIVDQSSDYLEHDMSFRQRLQFRMHLLMCHNCRRFIRQFKAAIQMTKSLSKATVSQAQLDVVRRRIEALEE
mgnify:CR=1 FL=1